MNATRSKQDVSRAFLFRWEILNQGRGAAIWTCGEAYSESIERRRNSHASGYST
jgi:hypothetical protein